MPIYSLIFSFFILVTLQSAGANEELASFCFEKKISLNSVKESINFILLENDRVSLRPEDHCLDIVTSPNRKLLLEKFLAKNSALIIEEKQPTISCHLELKTTKSRKVNSDDIKFGMKNNIAFSEGITKSVSTAELLLGANIPGRLSMGEQSVFVECKPSGLDNYDLKFYFEEKNRAIVSTSVTLKKFESLSLATIKTVLDDRNKVLGIPQTSIQKTEGSEDITYELKIN